MADSTGSQHFTSDREEAMLEALSPESSQYANDLISRAVQKADLLYQMMKYTNAAAGALFTPQRPTAQADPAIEASDPSIDYKVETDVAEMDSSFARYIREPVSLFGVHLTGKHTTYTGWTLRADDDVSWGSFLDMDVGLIASWYMMSPRAGVVPEDEFPLVSHWSDATFMQWQQARKDHEGLQEEAAGLSAFLFVTVENEDTDILVQEVLGTLGTGINNVHRVLHEQGSSKTAPINTQQDVPIISDGEAPELNKILRHKGASEAVYGHVTFSVESREGRLLLGSPHGTCSAYLLAQHKDQLGHKYIDRISVISTAIGLSSNAMDIAAYDFSLLFHVKDVK